MCQVLFHCIDHPHSTLYKVDTGNLNTFRFSKKCGSYAQQVFGLRVGVLPNVLKMFSSVEVFLVLPQLSLSLLWSVVKSLTRLDWSNRLFLSNICKTPLRSCIMDFSLEIFSRTHRPNEEMCCFHSVSSPWASKVSFPPQAAAWGEQRVNESRLRAANSLTKLLTDVSSGSFLTSLTSQIMFPHAGVLHGISWDYSCRCYSLLMWTDMLTQCRESASGLLSSPPLGV